MRRPAEAVARIYEPSVRALPPMARWGSKAGGVEMAGDAELKAMQATLDALSGLDEEEQQRVVEWLASKLGLDAPAPGSGMSLPGGGGPGSAGGAIADIKAFATAKRPYSDVLRLTTLAYHLTHAGGRKSLQERGPKPGSHRCCDGFLQRLPGNLDRQARAISNWHRHPGRAANHCGRRGGRGRPTGQGEGGRGLLPADAAATWRGAAQEHTQGPGRRQGQALGLTVSATRAAIRTGLVARSDERLVDGAPRRI